MKITFIFSLLLAMISFAYISAQQKIKQPVNIQALHLGMTLKGLHQAYGVPSAQNRNRLTYIFEDHSELVITLRDEVVASARLRFQRPLKIQDPKMKQLTLVQMESESASANRPSWFFAGKPEEGLIYKITAEGVVESLTWVAPFSYASNQPKRLQALLRDFQNKHFNKM